jgi:hypothetical protein
MRKDIDDDTQGYLSDYPKREWVGLTDDETEEIWQGVQASDFHDCVQAFAQFIEAKLKEKNT